MGHLVPGEGAENPTPQAGVSLFYADACDTANRRLYIENHHTSRYYTVTVRWNAAGGKTVSADFLVEPNVAQEVGCAAAGAQIVKAVLADF